MAQMFAPEYEWMWTLALFVALFFPTRHLIWVLSVRRAEAKHGPTDEALRRTLKRRAGFTAVLFCFVFAVIYSSYFLATRL